MTKNDVLFSYVVIVSQKKSRRSDQRYIILKIIATSPPGLFVSKQP